ncbi:serine hydrolase domain-containing protein [Streptomyces javensis]|uniref:serine hydrolase domain-containing protein n=1 Tax=Streptomyces javensis TaxID=114698 RepID=UPI003F4D471C
MSGAAGGRTPRGAEWTGTVCPSPPDRQTGPPADRPARLAALLAAGRRAGIYSAAAWSVGTAVGRETHGHLGTRRWGGAELNGTELWDLASVTKPIVGLAALRLAETGALRLDDTVGAYLPEYRRVPGKADITVTQLLTHTSGLPGGTPLWRAHSDRDGLLAALRGLPLRGAPGTVVEYSSAGFVLLGLILERATATGLDELVATQVCEPLGMRETVFAPGAAARDRAVSTELCTWRGRLVTGQVHDENAVVLGGVCGHAGLFAPLTDMDRLGRALAAGGDGLLSAPGFARMTACHTEGLPLRRCLGWQGRDAVGSPVGTAMGPSSYGHTGFTGTSLWVEPAVDGSGADGAGVNGSGADRAGADGAGVNGSGADRAGADGARAEGRYYVLLTNRVHPSRAPRRFPAVRRAFHHHAAALARP